MLPAVLRALPRLSALFAVTLCASAQDLVPATAEFQLGEGHLDLPTQLRIEVSDPSLRFQALALHNSWCHLTGQDASIADTASGQIILNLDGKLAPEQYRLNIDERIEVFGGSSVGVAHGTASLLQLATTDADTWRPA